MATKKSAAQVTDLDASLKALSAERLQFEAKAQTVIAAAMEKIAEKFTDVQNSLDEIGRIAGLAGITELDFDDLFYKVDNLRDEYRDWNSSNC